MRFSRYLDIAPLLEKRSLFLLGPRQTGKTWWLRQSFPGVRLFNLLQSDVYQRLVSAPHQLREEILPDDKVVVIDEVQKVPELLDEIHYLIEERGINFLLTGSSARRLKAGRANLLGGRARVQNFHPLSWIELGQDFDLMKALTYGLLPSIYLSDEPRLDLHAYAGVYLKEEIAAEGVSRNIAAFSRFLEVAALNQGELINYTNIANDSQTSVSTIRAYYQVLEDTLLGFQLLPWTKSIKRKAISTSKFYFFDIGVARNLQGRHTLERASADFGNAFESYIFHELKTYTDYRHKGLLDLHFWRSKSGYEVDFILGESTAIEVKSAKNVTPKMFKGMMALNEEQLFKNKIIVTPDTVVRNTEEKIQILPYQVFLEKLWGDELL